MTAIDWSFPGELAREGSGLENARVTRIVQPLRQKAALVVLAVLLLVGVAIVVAFTGRGDPPTLVIWLGLVWLLALVGAMAAYARSTHRGPRR